MRRVRKRLINQGRRIAVCFSFLIVVFGVEAVMLSLKGEMARERDYE